MYAGRVTATTRGTRAGRAGSAVALVTAPGVLLAQFVVADTLPSWRAALIVCAIVAAVACAVPTRGAVGTAAVAAAAQLAGHVGLALTGPQSDARQGCLSVVGRGADLGVRYALVRGDACPPGVLSAAPALAAVVPAVARGPRWSSSGTRCWPASPASWSRPSRPASSWSAGWGTPCARC